MSPLLAHLSGGGGLLDGLLHPVTGPDHLVAMALVGVLAYVLRDRLAGWVLPASFLGAMVVGGVAGIAGISLGDPVELVVGASVTLLAVALVFADRVPATALAAGVAVVALAHGLAHGGEVPAAANPALYVVGFVAATVVIHLAGVGAGRAFAGHRSARLLAGGAAALVGLALLAS
jgi:urease accessory protein